MRAYLDALTGHGVTGYSWDDLVRDYQIALAYMFFYPVWDALDGSSRDYLGAKAALPGQRSG